jgi:hypothetical protein
MPRGRPLLRRLRLPFRRECFNDGAATADRTPVSALPKRCPATGRLRPRRSVVLAGGLEPPPLVYEASALPDELSQPIKIGKGSRRRSRCGSDLVRCAEGRRRVQFWTFTMSKSAAPTGTVVMRMRSHDLEHAQTRACPRHRQGFWMFCGPSAPSCLFGGGESPAPVIPVSVSSLVRPNRSSWRSPDIPCTRPRTADRSVDWTVRWRR